MLDVDESCPLNCLSFCKVVTAKLLCNINMHDEISYTIPPKYYLI